MASPGRSSTGSQHSSAEPDAARRWLRRCFFIAWIAVGVVAGTEAVLRLFHLAPVGGVFTVSEAEYGRVPGIFSPNRSFVERRIPALTHRITIDSLGYRGRDVAIEPRPGEARVFVTGDSFTWGDFVEDEETLPARLERALAAVCRDVTVMNGGVPSTTILGQAEMVRRALPLRPAVAIVVFHDNDLREISQVRMWDQLAVNRAAKSRFPLSIAYPVLRETATWNLALEARRRWVARNWTPVSPPGGSPPNGSPPTGSAPGGPAYHSAPDDDPGEAYLRELTRLRDDLEGSGTELVLVGYPGLISGLSGDENLTGWATGAAEAAGIPAFDLAPVLLGSHESVEALSQLPYDGHPSPLAHRLSGDAMAAWLTGPGAPLERCR